MQLTRNSYQLQCDGIMRRLGSAAASQGASSIGACFGRTDFVDRPRATVSLHLSRTPSAPSLAAIAV